MLIPEMVKTGWEVEVMYPDGTYQAAYSLDSDSPRFFPETKEHPVGPWLRGLFKAMGSRSIGIRAGVPVARKGLELLRSRKYDVVYFSTTQHLLTCAGPCWRRKTGVPYVADVHDPVFIPRPKYQTSGSGLKARIARQVGRWIEKTALAQADGIVSVSHGYVEDLLERNQGSRWTGSDMGYRILAPEHPPLAHPSLASGMAKMSAFAGGLEMGSRGVAGGGSLVAGNFPSSISHLPYPTSSRVLVQPFPADERGLEMVEAERRETGKKRIVYVGAGGTIMEKGWREFLGQLKKEPLAQEVGIEIYGTDPFWKVGERRHLQSIAEEMGLKGMVVEEPKRISYERSLALVKGADGLLVLGVDDPSYQPSKLHTYLATGLPVLILAREGSTLPRQMEDVEGVKVLRFEGSKVLSFGGPNEDQVEGGMREYFQNVKEGSRWPGRKRLTAKEAAIGHSQLFKKVVAAVSR